ncbi:MAG: PQQ-binding-like beta-propeller repeat protein [Burkholderiales bacterium]|nr:PQQ-binding-like beta-propeller repeat protein [Burkholderiales bacterium]
MSLLRRGTALLALLAGPALAASPNDWPQLGHDAAHSYSNPAEKTLKPGRFKDLTLLWSQKLGQFFVGASTVGQGRVVNCSNLQGIGAQDAVSGAPLWSNPDLPGNSNCGSAVLDAGTVWLATDDSVSKHGFLVALEPATGAQRWQRPLADPQSVGLLSPVREGKRLYIADRRSTVHALSARHGRPQWQVATGCYQNEPTVGAGRVFLSTWYYCAEGSMRLISLDATDGTARWTQLLSGDSWYAPLLQGPRVHVSTVDGWVRAFDADSGAPQWSLRLDHYPAAPLVDGGDTVFANDGSAVYAIDAASGALRWKTVMPRGGSIASNLVLAAGSLFHTVIEQDGTHRLGVVNAATGKAGARSAESMFGDFAQVTVADGRVQVASNYGYLYVFGLPAR